MTTPQAPAKRNKQKRRRTKKLAEWRAKHPAPAKKAAPSDHRGASRGAGKSGGK